ncbi:MAG: hypothetical protein U9R57_00055 [Thermodesulfobacteriota bacterium]|nr:hypothetical protein [Thermodesulfobacteriota bacterium]
MPYITNKNIFHLDSLPQSTIVLSTVPMAVEMAWGKDVMLTASTLLGVIGGYPGTTISSPIEAF